MNEGGVPEAIVMVLGVYLISRPLLTIGAHILSPFWKEPEVSDADLGGYEVTWHYNRPGILLMSNGQKTYKTPTWPNLKMQNAWVGQPVAPFLKRLNKEDYEKSSVEEYPE